MQQDLPEHWEKVFSTKKETEFSWFQNYPETSMEFVRRLNISKDANIIDVGGGDSHFVDTLLGQGYANIYLLDISAKAIERVKARLGSRAANVRFIHSNILDFSPDIQFDLWHDRAAFHFLTIEEQIGKYVQIASGAIRSGGYLVMGTFSESGPKKCSGLEVKQYNESGLNKRFEKYFEKIECMTENHETPAHIQQEFIFCSFRRKPTS